MDCQLEKKLIKYHLKVIYIPSDRDGYLVRTTPDKPDIIVVKEGLSEEKTYQVIQHEIGHALKDKDVVGSYRDDYSARVKCESGADDYMIENLVKEEAECVYDISTVNTADFAHNFGVSYSKVREAFAKYIVEN